MWRKPFGSGGKRVTTRPPFFPAARSAATIARMKSLGAERSSGAAPWALRVLPGSRARRREHRRVVVEALPLDLAALDLVHADLAQRHRAPVAQVHGGVPLDADRLRADPYVQRLPARPRLHLLPALQLLLEAGEAARHVPGALFGGGVVGVERAQPARAEGRRLGQAHHLARERLEARRRGALRSGPLRLGLSALRPPHCPLGATLLLRGSPAHVWG